MAHLPGQIGVWVHSVGSGPQQKHPLLQEPGSRTSVGSHTDLQFPPFRLQLLVAGQKAVEEGGERTRVLVAKWGERERARALVASFLLSRKSHGANT